MTVPKPLVFGTPRGVNRPSLSEQVSQNALGESLTEPTEGHARALASQGKGYALTQYGIQSQDDSGTIPGASQPNLLKRRDDPGYPGFGTPLFLYYLLLFRPPPHAIGRVENPGLPGWTLIISHLTRDGPGIILGRTWETDRPHLVRMVRSVRLLREGPPLLEATHVHCGRRSQWRCAPGSSDGGSPGSS